MPGLFIWAGGSPGHPYRQRLRHTDWGGGNMQRVKNEHYVSQFCLRRFTMDGTRTWVFDKPTKRSFPRNVDEIASEEGFYDLSPKFSLDFQVMEKALGELETYT